MELKDWTIEYVKARDAMRKTLVSREENGDVVSFTHKRKVHHFLVSQELVVPSGVKDFFSEVCLQTPDNIDLLLLHWDELQLPNFTIVFVNIEQNRSWVINPKIHSLVADPETLEEGLRTMAAEVPYTKK